MSLLYYMAAARLSFSRARERPRGKERERESVIFCDTELGAKSQFSPDSLRHYFYPGGVVAMSAIQLRYELSSELEKKSNRLIGREKERERTRIIDWRSAYAIFHVKMRFTLNIRVLWVLEMRPVSKGFERNYTPEWWSENHARVRVRNSRSPWKFRMDHCFTRVNRFCLVLNARFAKQTIEVYYPCFFFFFFNATLYARKSKPRIKLCISVPLSLFPECYKSLTYGTYSDFIRLNRIIHRTYM